MEEKRYNVVFLGPAQTGEDYVNKLTKGLMAQFNLPIESVNKMMRWAPITVKKGLPFKEAANYRVILESLGAQVKLEPIDIVNEDKPVLQPETETDTSKQKIYLVIIATAVVIAIVIIIGLFLL